LKFIYILVAGFISLATTPVSRCYFLNYWVLYDQMVIPFTLLPDLRHICQNLNQFGHGRGTIYGGKKGYLQAHQYYIVQYYILQVSLEEILQDKYLHH